MNACEKEYKKFSKEFFDTLDEKLKIAKGQFEICDRCKQNTIEELEKIKEEIPLLPVTDTAIRLVSNIIDKHISELKGENK